MWARFPDICPTIEEKLWENFNQGIDPKGDRAGFRGNEVTCQPKRW